jgi:hypothetical protein
MISERVVREGLERFTPGAFPERSVDLPVDDEQIRNALNGSQTARPMREDVELARRFNRWRGMLLDAESRAKGKLRFLVGCYDDLRDKGDPYLDTCAEQVRAHVHHHFRCDASECPPVPDVAARDLWFSKAVRREDLVSTWLLYGLQSPRFIPQSERSFGDEDNAPHWSEGHGHG